MRRRNLVINGVLVAGVVAVASTSYVIMTGSSKSTAATGRTTTVRNGTVTATVAGSGNVTSAVNRTLSFTDCSGTLTSVLVSAGDRVAARQRLATVATTDAAQSVQTAQLDYDAALTSEQNAVSQASTQLANAQTAYTTDVDKTTAALTSAQSAVSTAQARVSAAQSAYSSASGRQKTAALQALNQAQTQLANAQTQLTNAQTQLADTKTKDATGIDSAQTALTQSQAVSSQSAMAVRNAQIALTAAQKALSGCTLLAPAAGTITAVNSSVGDTVGASSSGSSSGSSSSGSSTSGSSTSGGSSSSASSSSGTSSGSTSGFITMVDMTKLVIDTSFSELRGYEGDWQGHPDRRDQHGDQQRCRLRRDDLAGRPAVGAAARSDRQCHGDDIHQARHPVGADGRDHHDRHRQDSNGADR